MPVSRDHAMSTFAVNHRAAGSDVSIRAPGDGRSHGVLDDRGGAGSSEEGIWRQQRVTPRVAIMLTRCRNRRATKALDLTAVRLRRREVSGELSHSPPHARK